MRILLPLYVAGLVVTLCGIGAVLASVDDPSLGSVTVGMIVLGFGVSLALRLMRVDPNLALYPAFGLGFFLAARHFIAAGSLGEVLGGPLTRWQPDVALASFLTWLVVLRSFTLMTDYALLFCPVPTIALLGLTGSSNLNTEILVYFMVFLFSTIFLVGYEHYLRLQRTARQEPDPILRSHATTALFLFLFVTFAGCALTLVSRPVLSQLSPFAGPILRRAQQLPGFQQALQNQSNFVPVGSGPIDLSTSPVMEVYSSEGGLWRTRVMESWNGRGWAVHTPENPMPVIAENPVPVRPPRGWPREETYPQELYAIPLPPDRFRGPEVRFHRVHQKVLVRAPLSQAVPAAPRAVELFSRDPQVSVDDSGVIVGSYLNSSLVYEVVSEVVDREMNVELLRKAPPFNTQRPLVDLAYLDLPNDFDRVRRLAERITRDVATPYDKAVAIQTWLEEHCAYTLQEEAAPSGHDAVEYYLFTTREGACDLVGSAMALMCRAVGIPARVAVGYSRSERDEHGAFLVTQADAHLWVELYFPGYGWETFNPAPTPRTTPKTATAGLSGQLRRLWRNLQRGGMATTLSLLLLGALVGVGAHALNDSLRGLMRNRRAQQQMLRSDDASLVVPLLYGRMCDLLSRQGWPRRPAATPHEYLAEVRALPEIPPGVLDPAAALTEAFTAVRYGDRPLPPAEVEDARRQIIRLEETLKGQKAERR